MDTTLFQLFSLGEILARLRQTLQTGCLHVFTQRDAANLYFKDGIVVAAAKGPLEGEEVVKQIMEWKEAGMMWQQDEVAPTSLKSFGINILDHLQSPKPETEKSRKPDQAIKENQKTDQAISPAKPFVFTAETSFPSTSVPVPPPAKAAPKLVLSLSPVQAAPEPLLPKAVNSSQPVPAAPIQLTATKTIPSTAQMRSTQEEALLRKHKLVLVSADDLTQRFKIMRASSLIGRNPACDIHLNRASVSRQHCLLHLTDRGLHLKDLGTTNGTKVNGIVLTEGYVNPGDKVTIGHELFILEKDSA